MQTRDVVVAQLFYKHQLCDIVLAETPIQKGQRCLFYLLGVKKAPLKVFNIKGFTF